MRRRTRTSELPDLGRGNEIVTENVRASHVIYAAAMLEELKFFRVIDRLSQLFQLGLLTINRRSTGSSLYKYFKEAPLRLSETERGNLYATTIGAPGGVEGAVVNREFNDLWLRFLSRVASLNREPQIADDVAETNDVALRRAARELAQNLSLHGGGMAPDADLLNACKQWLSVSGLSDEQIETFAKPRPEGRTKTAR